MASSSLSLDLGSPFLPRCVFKGCQSSNATTPSSCLRAWSASIERVLCLQSFVPWGVKSKHYTSGLWNQGIYSHFCDTRESPPVYGILVFGKPFWLYHRSGFHFPKPCYTFFGRGISETKGDFLNVRCDSGCGSFARVRLLLSEA